MIGVNYTQNLKSLLSSINSDKRTCEYAAFMTNQLPDVVSSDLITFTSFITKLNEIFEDTELGTSVYTSVVPTEGDPVTRINNAFDDIYNAAIAVPYIIDVKTLIIPGKGTAKILAQQDNWKLAFYGTEDILYLSSDNGVTWSYSKAFTDCLLIRTAWVFKDGSVLIGRRDNKMFSSQDLLSTINEITVYDGESPMTFHEPVNPSYPGSYFSSGLFESGIINGTEVLLFGAYSFNDGVGAAPRILFYTIDNGVTVKVAYKWGQLASITDDGTATGGTGGTPLGDAGNEMTDDHCHFIAQNPFDKKFYIQTGDTNLYFLNGEYDIEEDSWAFTPTKMTNVLFRAVGVRFFDNDAKALWTSDGTTGGVLECIKANLISTNPANHTYKLQLAASCIGLTKYAQTMMTTRYSSHPDVYCSADYGQTWVAVPYQYWSLVTSLQATRYPLTTDSDGYILLKDGNSNGLFGNVHATYLIKITPKE